MPNVLQAHLDRGGLVQERLKFLDSLGQARNLFANEFNGARGNILWHAAGTHISVVHAQSGDLFKDAQNVFTLAESDRHNGGRAQFHTARSEGNEVGTNAVEFHHQNADNLRALRNVVGYPEEALNCQAIGDLLEERCEIIHAGAKRHALSPGAELHVLFNAGVQVSDAAAGFGDRFTVNFQDEPQNTVRRGVLRAHVDDNALFTEPRGLFGYIGPVATFNGVRAVVAGLGIHIGCEEVLICLLAHQLYDLRLSGAGIVAPLYSTGMPPSG